MLSFAEIEAFQRLPPHPNVLPLIHVCVDPFGFVTPWMPGGSLETALRKKASNGPGLCVVFPSFCIVLFFFRFICFSFVLFCFCFVFTACLLRLCCLFVFFALTSQLFFVFNFVVLQISATFATFFAS